MDDVPSHARNSTAGRVKNKAPAKIQITAEQLVREAWERQDSGPASIPKQTIADRDELLEYQREQRKSFEMRIVRNRQHTPIWIRYAKWEEGQGEMMRARSVWERAVDNDYRNPGIWQGYAEMEMRGGYVNHARNVLDRAVGLLPRVDMLWLKYAHMEELVGEIALARLVYERWLKWMPREAAYFALIRFEIRHGEKSRARSAYERLVAAHPSAHTFGKMAKFEEKRGEYARARAVYEKGTEVLKGGMLTAGFLIGFARFEERRKEVERVRGIYRYAMENVGEEEKGEVERMFVRFEKGRGEREVLDELVVGRKRERFERKLKEHAYDYDVWFDLVQLEQKWGTQERVKDVYEMAVSKVPLAESKLGWSKYIYLWIGYAVWMELSCEDAKAAAGIYARCIKKVPRGHRQFSFGKLWTLYAQVLLRMGDVGGARRVFGTGIGVMRKKRKIYEAYIEMEKGLGEIGRARRVYERWMENVPLDGDVFLEYAEFERDLGEAERAWGVLEVGRGIDGVSREEEIWEMAVEVGRDVSKVGDKLLQEYVKKVKGGKGWVVWAAEVRERGGKKDEVRDVFRNGEKAMRLRGDAAQVAVVVGEWIRWERDDGGNVSEPEKLMPRKIRRKRALNGEWEEEWEMPLHQDEGAAGKDLLLMAAKRWKMSNVSKV
eukprot:GFKZ01010820.1.p1 GENE.GFKZ01010820.1~~GFKZ01010820.1.p1  ORF type:complete len:662 (+),score=122.75 GFKZ01010820.1:107-2092(+)